MPRSVQLNLPPVPVATVDRRSGVRSNAVDLAANVDRWLAQMNQAIDESEWAHKQEALASTMGIDKAYLSRLRSGEKPWRVEHVVALPDVIEARFETLRAESFGRIVVEPATGEDAARQFIAGLFGVLREARRA